MTDLAARPHGRLAGVRDGLTPGEWARAGGMTGVIVGLHVVGWGMLAAAAWMPSPESVPPARVVSTSRSRASPAMSAFPVRAAASISSGKTHVEIYRCRSSLACRAAVNASAYRPSPLARMADVHCA